MWREAPPSPPEAFRRLLKEKTSTFGVSLSSASLSALARYLAMLDLWRRTTNLTGRLGASELAEHALESGFGERLIPQGAEVVDIGSGAGFPGLPLAILRPDICVTPIEPRRKRMEFLKHVAETVPLKNVFACEMELRYVAQDFADVATSRAVGRIAEVLGGAPFLKRGGLYLAWTTEPAALSQALAPAFQLERVLPIPGARKKGIAAFRKQ